MIKKPVKILTYSGHKNIPGRYFDVLRAPGKRVHLYHSILHDNHGLYWKHYFEWKKRGHFFAFEIRLNSKTFEKWRGKFAFSRWVATGLNSISIHLKRENLTPDNSREDFTRELGPISEILTF